MKAKNTRQPAPQSDISGKRYQIFLWSVLFLNSLFLIWQCLDRYLAPRFLFLSVALTVALAALRHDLKKHADWRLHTFDLLLLGWYGINLASVFWAFSWSEGIFYAQKVLLLFSTYWLLRQTLHRDETAFTRTLSNIIPVLTIVVCGIIGIQLMMAISKNGLDNQTLYDYASGVYGNKSLASDFLFFLLIFNLLFIKGKEKKLLFLIGSGVLSLLILLLQTRTVYLAVAAAAILYTFTAGLSDPKIRPIFVRWVIPSGAVLTVLFAAFLFFKGGETSLGERLNPLTYLESTSANERRFVWYKTDLLNEDHFWWGVGNGSWKFWLPSKTLQGAFRLQEQGIVFTRAHNDYLEVRAEMGITGAIWFIALFIATGIGLAAAWRQPDISRHETAVVAAGLLGYCIIQYFDFPRERIEMQVMLAALFALAAHRSRLFWSKLPGVNVAKSGSLFTGLLVIGLLFNVVIGFYRVNGEIHNVNMAKAYQKQDFKTVLKEARATQNMFLEYNDVGLPIKWYEGTAWYRMKDYDKAVTAFGEALALNPWSFQVLNNYATALASQEKYNEAIPYFEKAVEINPKYDEGKFNLAYSYTQLKQYDKALEWVKRVDTIPNPPSDAERKKNQSILENKANFLKGIQEKMGQNKPGGQ